MNLYNLLKMILAILLINLFFIYEIGYWRYIGLIGFMMVGWHWDKGLDRRAEEVQK